LSGHCTHQTSIPQIFICGDIKEVYQNNPQTIGELKAAVTTKIIEIPKEACVQTIDNFAQHVHVLPPMPWFKGLHLHPSSEKSELESWH